MLGADEQLKVPLRTGGQFPECDFEVKCPRTHEQKVMGRVWRRCGKCSSGRDEGLLA